MALALADLRLPLRHIRKTHVLLFMLFVLLLLFSSKKSKNQESMGCSGKANPGTFRVVFPYFFYNYSTFCTQYYWD